MSDFSEEQIRQLKHSSDWRRTARDVLSGVGVGALGSYAAYNLLRESTSVSYELLFQACLVAVAIVATVWAVRNSALVDQNDQEHFDHAMKLLDRGDERMQRLELDRGSTSSNAH